MKLAALKAGTRDGRLLLGSRTLHDMILADGAVVARHDTNLAWANRPAKTCRIAFVRIDGQFEQDLQILLPAEAPS